MPQWTSTRHAGDHAWSAASVRKSWARLHIGDNEQLPQDARVLEAWVLFHNGQFQQAAEAGSKAGAGGITVANKATVIHATYLEPRERTRLDLFMEVAARAEAQAKAEPGNPNAWYWHAYALGRYSQGISVAKALAQGLGSRVKDSLERTIKLSPRHTDAHIALGAFHAEVIDKVGALIGSMTYGAKKEVGLRLFQEALRLNPGSVIGMIEYANALLMLEGDRKMPEATKLFAQAAASQAVDATERLDVRRAGTELAIRGGMLSA